MKNYRASSKRKSAILLAGVFSSVFQTLVPYFHSATASTPDGYSQVICTLNGFKTVIVALEDEQQQNPPGGYECPACIAQANANGWIEADSPFIEPRFILRQSARNNPFYRASTEPVFPHFLSRAPPL